jgi:hypothetical protein
LFLLGAETLFRRFHSLLFSGPQWRFIDPFSLVVPDGPLEGHSIAFHIDFELQLIIIRKIGPELMSHLVVLLELAYKVISRDLVLAQLEVLAMLPLHSKQRKILLSGLVVIGKVKVEPAAIDGQHRPSTHHLETGLNWNLILIEFLLSCIGEGLPLLTVNL